MLVEADEDISRVPTRGRVLEQWTSTLRDPVLTDGTSYKLRFIAPEMKGKPGLYRLNADGSWKKISYQKDGSYLVFDADSTENTFCVTEEPGGALMYILLCAAVIILLILLIVIKRLKKKRKARKAAKEQPEENSEGVEGERRTKARSRKNRRKMWTLRQRRKNKLTENTGIGYDIGTEQTTELPEKGRGRAWTEMNL